MPLFFGEARTDNLLILRKLQWRSASPFTDTKAFMKQIVQLSLAVALSLSVAIPAFSAPAAAVSAVPDAAHVQAVQQLMVAMQAEKMMRSTAGASRYANEAQRQSVFDKLQKVPPGEIHRRLAAPVARVVSAETAVEMSKFYASSYGQKILQQTYNSGPSMYGAQEPVPVGAEKAQLKAPALIKARKEMAAADQAIRHEAFVLLGAIVKGK